MTTPTAVQDVLKQALALTDEERRQLFELLSLAFEPEDVDDEWDDQYEAELDEIEAAMKAGTMKTYSLEEVREFVRQKLARAD